ncbi:unnamed protein product [Spodoptera littoralis]|uniref:BPTI/Kunitz inhibitor domain-containing protein n=1 Tax=Spodoptera littoralis TaxID=7109 RepID=A0A9P0N9G9_SPOLI|nr:unnamed protein product [Spodoptera littoralis]CAH1646285.1 unnamed protein product [Spodoptera littoralis]
MSCSWCSQSYLVVILNVLHIAWTVPPEYCLAPFNRSDCNLPPRHVFAYYKPGSRCELEVWRGCPTLNKFENEYLCSMNCIFRSRMPGSEFNECASTLDTTKCTNKTQTVYTHVDGRCIKAEWGGCQTYNKFDSKAECDEKCATVNIGSSEINFIVQDINEILEQIIIELTNSTNTTNVTTDAFNATSAYTSTTQATTTKAINTGASTTVATNTKATTKEATTTETTTKEANTTEGTTTETTTKEANTTEATTTEANTTEATTTEANTKEANTTEATTT